MRMNTTKRRALRGLISTLASLALAGLPSAAILRLVPEAPSVSLGTDFTVSVQVEDVTDLYAFNFSVLFNQTVLGALNVTEGSFLSDVSTTFFIPGDLTGTPGLISFVGNSLLGIVPGATGNGEIARITFGSIGSGVSALALTDVLLLDSAFADIAATFNGATVTVVGGGGGTTPIPPIAFMLISGLVLLRRTNLR
jgi:hypothetical protein